MEKKEEENCSILRSTRYSSTCLKNANLHFEQNFNVECIIFFAVKKQEILMTLLKYLLLKSSQVYFKLTQLIGGTFPRHFQNKKVNNGTLHEREQAKIVDVRKRNSKLSGKSSSTELGQFVVNLTRL